MKKFFAAVMALALIASPGAVWAEDDNGNGNGNGPTNINVRNRNRNNVNIRNRNQNNIRNTNRNSNRNSNYNSNRNSNYNSNRNSNKNLNLNLNKNVNRNTNRQNQGQYQGQDQYQGQGQAQGQFIKDKNQQTTVVEGDDFKAYAPAPNIFAPSLTSGNDVCMGSISVGGSGGTGIIGFGIALGKTYTDDNCVRLKNANALLQMGHKNAALALLALNEDVAAALNAAGVTFASVQEMTEELQTEKVVSVSETTVQNGVYYGIDFEMASD